MRKIFTLIVAFCLSFSSIAQLKITGSVNDPNENKPVQNAVIALLTPVDSVFYKFTRSDAQGKYVFNNVKPGKYILITTHPYFADVLEDIDITSDKDFSPYALISKAKILQEVIIKTGSPLRIKGDTTIYTADSFKVSANANVEELLKKLPGIQVDKDGKIKAMGETVQKVLVDGEEFFGDDPGMAVKNLRADAVKEVQVFDKKSEQAEFTGIDDGKTQKTINLKLKEDKKIGYFGKVDAAGGLINSLDPRYNTNLLFSSFKGKRKLSGFLLSGNTGQDGLNWEDQQKFGGESDNMTISVDDDGGVMMMWRGGTSDDEPYFDSRNGYITNVNAGISYNNKWNENKSFSFSPKYNSQKYLNHKLTFKQTQLGDSVLNENDVDITNISRHNFKNRMIFDFKLDSMNSLKLTAGANFYHTESDESRTSITAGQSGALKNTTNRSLQTNSDKDGWSANLIFKHKFAKEKRTLSVTADWNLLDQNGKNFLKSFNEAFYNGNLSGTQVINQMKDYDKSTQNLSAIFVYTEPVGKKFGLELGYQLRLNYGNNDQLTYTYSPGSGKYDVVIDSLSNQFRQNILQHVPSARINYAGKMLKVNFGSGFGFTNFDLKDETYNKEYKRNYTNFFPSANFVYTYKANHSVRINYQGNTQQPSINQLQPLRNNNDYFNQYIGNPDLKPSFTNSFNMSHNSYNFLKDFWMYQSLNVRFQTNAITNNRTINLDSGKTITQPVNTNGNMSIGLWSGIGFKIKKIDTRFNLNPNLNYNKFADVINGRQSFSKTFSPGIDFSVSKSKDKVYDVSIRNSLQYSSNTTSQNSTKIHYITNTVSFDGTVYFSKSFYLSTDYQFYSRQKTLQANGLNTNLWNARLIKTFKKDEFTAYLTVRDILNQNVGIDRNFYSNTYSEVINDRLKRYFLVGFTWNFKNKAAAPTNTNPTK